MKAVFDQVLVLVLFFFGGWTLCRRGIVRDTQAGALSACVIYFFLPCTMLRTFASNFTAEYLAAKYPILIVGSVMTVAIVLLSSPLSKRLTGEKYQQAVFEYLLVCPSYAYIGYELCRSLYGDIALLDLIVFTIPSSVLYTYSVGYCRILKKPLNAKYLLNPTIIAIVLGAVIGLTGAALPNAAAILAEKASACTAPVGMMTAGAAMARYSFREMLRDKTSYVLVAFRLLIIPAAAYFALRLLGLDEYIRPAILMLAMPVGTNTVVFPKMIDEECRTSASALLTSHILCLATIPLLVSCML